MRWRHIKVGSVRVRRIFAIRPRVIDGYYVWLEWVWVKEKRYGGTYDDGDRWVEIGAYHRNPDEIKLGDPSEESILIGRDIV